MAQVRPEYLRWIVTHFWNSGVNMSMPEPSLRQIAIATLPKFREDCLDVLKTLSDERFREIRDAARVWLLSLDDVDRIRVLQTYDEDSTRLPKPYRIDWTKRIPVMHPGTFADKNV